MKWHLCNPMGVSERTTEADSEFWAKRRFVPIPKGWFVASDASYQMGWRMPEVVELCAKCFRNPPAPGNKKCETCRKRDRVSSDKANAKRAPRKSNAVALRKYYAERETPEARERKAAKLRAIMPQVIARRNPKVRERQRQADILRGIERRRAKRQATQLSLFGA